jgi:hypothetical protein
MAGRPRGIDEACTELERLEGRRAEWREETERAVVEWRWAPLGSPLCDPWPYSAERAGSTPDRRLLERAPRRKADGSELGLDADGNVAVVRDYDDDDELVFETFVASRGEDRHSVTFERGAASGISILRHDGDRLTAVDSCARAGWNQERYLYAGDRIVTIERERVQWGDEAPDLAWNPAEFELYADRAPGLLLDGDPELLADCDELNQVFRDQEREIEGTQAVCNAVAKRLNALDWHGRLPVTDDFLVFATDLELGELGDNLRAVLGGRRVRQLVEHGRLDEQDA